MKALIARKVFSAKTSRPALFGRSPSSIFSHWSMSLSVITRDCLDAVLAMPKLWLRFPTTCCFVAVVGSVLELTGVIPLGIDFVLL